MSDIPNNNDQIDQQMDTEDDTSIKIEVTDGPTSTLDLNDPDVQVLNLDDVEIDENDLLDDMNDDTDMIEDEMDIMEQYGIDEEDEEEMMYDDHDDFEHNEPHIEREPVVDTAFMTYKGHTDSVYCVAVDQVHRLLATGGGDDEAHVIDLTTGQLKYKCTGNNDSIIYVGFSYKSEYLLVAAMDGRMAIYHPFNGELLQEFHTETDVDIVQWHHSRNLFAIGCGDGVVWTYNADTEISQSYYGQQDMITALAFSNDGTQLITASQDQSLVIRDITKQGDSHRIKYPYIGDGEAPIISIAVHPKLQDLALGLANGGVFTCQSKSEKIQLSLKQAHQDGVEAITFGTALIPSLFSASVDGNVKSWDPSRGTNRFTLSHPEAVTKLVIHPSKPLIVSGCQDGVIRVFNMRTGALLKEFTGHTDGILDLLVLRDIIVSASDDKTAKIFDIKDIRG